MAANAKKLSKKKTDVGYMYELTKGFVKENPIFTFLLGMCPALAVTGNVENAVGMGLLVIFVLVLSNVVVSLIKDLIPNEVKIPSYIVIISTFVTIVGLLTEAYAPALHSSLGIFLPLIVVNCLILGRAESFASKNNVVRSAIDGLGMGLGFMGALIVIAFFREFFATGGIAYGVYLPLGFEGVILGLDTYFLNMDVFAGPAGGFLVIGLLLGLFQTFSIAKKNKLERERKQMIEEKKRIALEKKKQKQMESAGGKA